jgi:hypothetical protein
MFDFMSTGVRVIPQSVLCSKNMELIKEHNTISPNGYEALAFTALEKALFVLP